MRDRIGRDLTAQDEQAITAFMRALAALPASLPDAPPAEVVWVKAQLLKRWEAERRAHAPLDLMEPVEIVGGLLAAGVLFVWSVPALLRAAFTTMEFLW